METFAPGGVEPTAIDLGPLCTMVAQPVSALHAPNNATTNIRLSMYLPFVATINFGQGSRAPKLMPLSPVLQTKSRASANRVLYFPHPQTLSRLLLPRLRPPPRAALRGNL
jgi:hypothetical protein